MIHSLSNRINTVMYSCTHRNVNSNSIIRQSNGLRLTLKKDMLIIFHQGLIHAGGKLRMGKFNISLEDMQLFAYPWTSKIKGYNTRNDAIV